MFKVSLVFIFSLICNGCASSSSNSSAIVQFEKQTTKLERYASNDGCKLLKNGYMVCPKSK